MNATPKVIYAFFLLLAVRNRISPSDVTIDLTARKADCFFKQYQFLIKILSNSSLLSMRTKRNIYNNSTSSFLNSFQVVTRCVEQNQRKKSVRSTVYQSQYISIYFSLICMKELLTIRLK